MKYQLVNLIDKEKVQALLVNFNKIMGLAAAITDLEGNLIVGNYAQRICRDFHRKCNATSEKCFESDTILANKVSDGEKVAVYRCRNGMTDAASPIIIEGEHCANIFIGQFFLEKPDKSYFKKQALIYGFDQKDYLNALSEVQIITEEKLPAIIDFLRSLAEMVTNMGVERLRQMEIRKAFDESEETYRMMFEHAGVSIHVVDAETGVPMAFNREAYESLGYSREEFLALKLSRLDFDKGPNDILEHFKTIIKTGSDTFETDFITRDGERRKVLISAVPIKLGGRYAIHSICVDITQRKKLEEQLRKAMKMEAIGTLAGGIAHNFNNILGIIMANTDLALSDIESDHISYENLKIIKNEVVRGSRLTEQMLGFAQKKTYDIAPINLNKLIKETSSAFEETKKEVIVDLDLAEDLHNIKVDLGQIEQVLLNLFINAADAMPTGGTLHIKTMNVSSEDIIAKEYTPKDSNYILLTVTDTGTGMDENTQKRIFDPFFTTKGFAKGTGLGLSSTYGIVNSHGGYIDVISKIGGGTSFNIYLPVTDEKINEHEKLEKNPVSGKGLILFVDDEENILNAGTKMLTRLGYEILKAGSGKEAINIYMEKNNIISMVLLDMIMPGMGGMEVYNIMKEINPEIKVLLSSGYGMDGQATEILKKGCNGFIQKPFSMLSLSEKIKDVLKMN